MIVLINGPFGIGKTTVANLLCRSLSGTIYDPEWAGLVLMRLGKLFRLDGAGTGDFQDLRLWRKASIAGIRLVHYFVSGPLIVPMTFSNREYFDEVCKGVGGIDPELKVFCLTASLKTIRERLAKRGVNVDSREGRWLERRIVECDIAHRDPHFGKTVETEGIPAEQVAEYILEKLE